MEDPRWLRLITIGLVLAAIAVGYFLFTGRFNSNNVTKENQVSQVTPSPTTVVSPSPSILGQNATSSPIPTLSPTPLPTSAYNRIADRTQGGTQTLPRTGFPLGLAIILSISTIISGWGLRRFPH